MVHSKKAPEAVNLQAVQAALRMLQMNTMQEGVENYFGNELSLLAKMAGFQTNIPPPFIDKASPFAKQTEVIMPKYKSKKRRANGDGSYSVLQNGKIRYQAFAMDEQENLLYFDKDDRLTYRGNGTPKRLSGTGDTEGKAKSAYRAKCVAILQAGYYTKTRSKTTQELVREIPAVASPHDGRVYLSPSNPDGVCYYLIEWLKKNKKPGIHVKPKTFDHYMEVAERLYRFFGETDAAVIDRDCMQEFFDWMKTPAARKDHKNTGLSAKTINNTYVVLSEFFEDNIGKYFISNPCRKTKRDKAIVPEARVLEQDEQEVFIREALKEQRLGRAILIVLFTGLRLGEILALEISDFDFKKKRIYVNKDIVRINTYAATGPKTKLIKQDTPKSNTSNRWIPMNEEVEALAQAQFSTLANENNLNPLSLAFPSKNGTYTDPRTLQKRVDEVSKRCEAKGVHVHSLRHTFATRLDENKVPLTVIQSLLGHASIITTSRYSHALDRERQKAVETLEGAVFPKKEPPKPRLHTNCTQIIFPYKGANNYE